jgi:ABC-type bacteriocin/lantibiotic exporter with double-glycine peptidase domain
MVIQHVMRAFDATKNVLNEFETHLRAFDATKNVLNKFETHIKKYLQLSYKNAIAYYGFPTLTTSLPELIFENVIYYGGMLVRSDMTSGKLVSFSIY